MLTIMCQRCYDAECKRLGQDALEVFTIVASGPCSYCGSRGRYALPGRVDRYAPPQINEVR